MDCGAAAGSDADVQDVPECAAPEASQLAARLQVLMSQAEQQAQQARRHVCRWPGYARTRRCTLCTRAWLAALHAWQPRAER
jgi:hypothetical protein